MKKLINKEISLYVLFGVLTTLLNIGLFQILCIFISSYKIANIITLIVVKIVSYVCNKLFVFKSITNNIKELSIEFIKFIITRFITLLIDYFGLILLVEVLFVPKLIGKVVVVLIVVIINYIFGKKYVFNKKVNNEVY